MRTTRLFVPALAALLALPGPIAAQGRDFLFRSPDLTLDLQVGHTFARANSDVYTDLIDLQTLSRNDFDQNGFRVGLGYQFHPHFDLSAEVARWSVGRDSEYRDYVETVDGEDLPIQQHTSLVEVPLTATLRAYLLPRGRSVGRFAWVPNRFAPYVGVGGGAIHYDLEITGDFVDFTDLSIFSGSAASDGWAPLVHVLAGAEFSIVPRLGLRAEARYAWASADLGRDFVGYQPIDLDGLRTTAGLFLRF